MWQESLEIIPRMWTESPFEYDGKYVKIPPRDVIPKPIQQPHPPIWAAATSPATWELAGKNGIGILGLTIFVSVKQLEDRVRAYKAALREAKPVGKFVNDQVGAFTIVHVAETKEEAIANGAADAAINYLLYAFRVLGGFADPSGKGMQREYADLEIKSTPYRDLIAKEYPLIAKMQRGECTFEELDAEGHGDRRRRGPRHQEGREVQGCRPRSSPLPHAGRPHPAREGHAIARALRRARDAALPVTA
jgi:alkanesulfonate monooxygenase SsuD/methylene tetrahydromethanopterin reductase-like flavin-dependent oxidoreductase (luciferase family)